MSQDPLWSVVKVLASDYSDYGGRVERGADDFLPYPDCSEGCRYWRALDNSWGVCANPGAPRAGLLTWEHQAGFGCFDDTL